MKVSLNETQLKEMISESVKSVIKEMFNDYSPLLKAAAEEYAKGEGLEDAVGGWEDMYEAFIQGALWQKEHNED